MQCGSLEILSKSRQDTWRIGKALSKLLHSGDVVTLQGDLGSGKTILTKGICEGLEVMDRVTSPTFTIVQEYSGRLPVFHFDFYRMKNVDEVAALDIDYYLDQSGVFIIEWAERADTLFPDNRFHVAFSWIKHGDDYDENQRKLTVSAPAGYDLTGLNG